MLPNPTTKVQSYAGHWNVQVVRGKVTTRCLWNACRALAVGISLLLLGTTMAVIGYYAEQLSEGDETIGNATIHVKYETRGFHLNNLSYAGPIIMGIGGFIVVAACVMTFEARDSAAKVVPARFKPSNTPSSVKSTSRATRPSSRHDRRAVSCQTRQSLHAQETKGQGQGMSRWPSLSSLVDGPGVQPSDCSVSKELNYLSSHLLPRQAESVDCGSITSPGTHPQRGLMTLDLHEWRATLSVEDETKKKRLLRQKTTEDVGFKKSRCNTGHQKLKRSASTSTQTRTLINCADSVTCGKHRFSPAATPKRHRSVGACDKREGVNAALRRHCSVGPSSSCVYASSICQCTSRRFHDSRLYQHVCVPTISSQDAVPGCSDGVLNNSSPQRRLSRASCPSPRRTRSPSPSSLPGPAARKASLPSQPSLSI